MYPSSLSQLTEFQALFFGDYSQMSPIEFQQFLNNFAKTSNTHVYSEPDEVRLFYYSFKAIKYNDERFLPSSIRDLLICATCYQKAADTFPISRLKRDYYFNARCLLNRIIKSIDSGSEIAQNHKSLYGYAFNLRGVLDLKYNLYAIQHVINDFKKASELEYPWANANLAFVYNWICEGSNGSPSYILKNLKQAFLQAQKALEAGVGKIEPLFAERILSNQEDILRQVLRIEGAHQALKQFLLKLIANHHPSAKIVLAESYYRGLFCDTSAEYHANLLTTICLLTEVIKGQSLEDFPFSSFQQAIRAQKLLEEVYSIQPRELIMIGLKSELKRIFLFFKLKLLLIKYEPTFNLLNKGSHDSNSLEKALFSLNNLHNQLKDFDADIRKEYFQQLIDDPQAIPVIKSFCSDCLKEIHLQQVREHELEKEGALELQKIFGKDLKR